VAVYLVTVIVIGAFAFITGWRMGRKHPFGKNASPMAAGILLALGVLWLAAAKFTRSYADTDSWGTDAAGWFAHSGKWFVLLGAMLVGHGWICVTRQIPAAFARRIFYFVAVLGIVSLVMVKTVPVYFLLGEGRRDENGCVRQSETIEVTCGAVALLNYLERFQHHAPLTEREVSRNCGVTTEGTTTAAIISAARAYGLTNATARVLTLAELEKSRLPAIVSISTLPTVHHATLLIKLDAGRACFIDPAYGFRDMPRDRFLEIWYGRTVLLE
jgi:predicted double-glycine peptidase